MNATIRRVRPGDEGTLAHIQSESWKAAFAGIISPETLAQHTDVERLTAMYRRLLDSRGLIPFTSTLPESKFKSPVNTLIVVDLPAPLGPIKPYTLPASTLKLTSLSASFGFMVKPLR